MPNPAPNTWSALWQSIISFHAEKVTPWIALRNSIGLALPLAIGAGLGAASSGFAVSMGALNVSFSDSDEPYPIRAKRMLASSMLVGTAVFVGEVCGDYGILAVLASGLWAFAAGMLVALSPAAADLGVVSLVTLVVYEAAPHAPGSAAYSGLLAFAGGLVQTALAVAFWPLRRYVPERRVLGELYGEIAKSAAPIDPNQPPPKEAPASSEESTRAQTSLAALDRDRSIEAERYRLLLSQAERIRLGLLTLTRLRARIARDSAASAEAGKVDLFLEAYARLLGYIAHSLLAGQTKSPDLESVQAIEAITERLRETNPAMPPEASALIGDARVQMDALAGQLRAAMALAADATAAGPIEFERRESSMPWHLRLSGTLATLRANLNLESAAFRHAARMAACVAIGEALGRTLGIRRSYWTPMTIAIVLKPDFTSTFSRGVLRLAGTFGGLVFATGLFHVVPFTPFPEVALITALMFIIRWLGGANYGIFVLVLTALVVGLFALTGIPPNQVIGPRALNTAIGGLIALLGYGLWPTWERTQVSEALARMLDAYRNYFRAIRETYFHLELPSEGDLDRVRLAARLARSNVEASVERLYAEPGATSQTVTALSGILASSHRMVHAIMSLEAGLYSSTPSAPRPPFGTFANDVEFTLYYLAAALRGSPLTPDDLPDLREDHHTLVHSGNSPAEWYALVNIETDRITNSLDTLSAELLAWIGSRAK